MNDERHQQSSGEHDQKDNRGSPGQQRTGNVRQEHRDRLTDERADKLAHQQPQSPPNKPGQYEDPKKVEDSDAEHTTPPDPDGHK